jgi:hypothetical protein
VLALLSESLTPKREDCAVLAGKSTLNRLEHGRVGEPTRYHKIGHDTQAIEALFVDLFLEAHEKSPGEIVLDLDATDDLLHGHEEDRFFHGYYNCYCYLPLYIFCGRHLLAAKLRRSNIDASKGSVDEVERIVRQIRKKWRRVRIILRADSGFARDELMSWCEANRVDYVFGIARNERLERRIAPGPAGSLPGIQEKRPGCACVPRLYVIHERQLVALQAGHRQGRVDDAGAQSALHRHFAQSKALGGTGALRGSLGAQMPGIGRRTRDLGQAKVGRAIYSK